MVTSSSRLVIAGLSGDSGKTIATLGILEALSSRGLSLSVFKKGPDYIDPAWLSQVSQTVCRNLDTYMVDPDLVYRRFVVHAGQSDIAVIEGNRGLFDGKDVSGTQSTAELAKLLKAPVVLVVSAAKSTRTVAATVKGCLDFDPDVNIAGVILNRVAGERHRRILTESIARYTGLSVLGTIPKLDDDSTFIPGRHLGLVTPAEYKHGEALRARLREIADRHLDIDGLVEVARSAGSLSSEPFGAAREASEPVRVGYFRDSVFTFYYPENLEALQAHGTTLVPVSSLSDSSLPEIDALYIGGGFPETHAEQLAGNRSLMESVKRAAEDGLPIYAECGGLIYLSRSLRYNDGVYPMAGLFPLDLRVHEKPVGHGYALARVDGPNPFYAVGALIRGHEFHYSGPVGSDWGCGSCMNLETGVGLGGGRDGLVYANTLACYMHVHSDGVGVWATSMVSRAADRAVGRRSRKDKNDGTDDWPKLEAI